jgi:hypothetical protein
MEDGISHIEYATVFSWEVGTPYRHVRRRMPEVPVESTPAFSVPLVWREFILAWRGQQSASFSNDSHCILPREPGQERLAL